MLTPAPEVRRLEMGSSVDHWTKTFLATGAPRTRLGLLPLMWLLVVCTVVFPVGVWSRSEVATNAAKVHTNTDYQPEAPMGTDVPGTNALANSAENTAEAKTDVNTNTGDAKPANTVANDTVTNTAVEAQSQKPVSTTEKTDAAPALPATENAGADSTQNTPSGAALPNIPNPELAIEAGVPTPATTPLDVRSLKVRAIVSGKARTGTVKLPAGATVAQALLEMGIAVNPLDRLSPLANAKAFNGMTVRVTRVRADEKKRTVTVEPQTVYQLNPSIPSGREYVTQYPQSGIVEITEKIWSKDGKVTLREQISRTVKQQAKDKVIALGVRSYYMPGKVPYHNRYARAYALTARSGSPRDRMAVAPVEGKTLRPVRSIVLTATGYSPDPRENGGYTVTATGLPIGYGAAAVDPRVIPLGTKMYVEGYGYAFACDVGGAIKGKRIDLAYDSYRLANTKGRKKVRVWILGN